MEIIVERYQRVFEIENSFCGLRSVKYQLRGSFGHSDASHLEGLGDVLEVGIVEGVNGTEGLLNGGELHGLLGLPVDVDNVLHAAGALLEAAVELGHAVVVVGLGGSKAAIDALGIAVHLLGKLGGISAPDGVGGSLVRLVLLDALGDLGLKSLL